jgi:acyl-CoA synthetase (AMP-forming)/AMP-acid ligase II
MNLLEVFARQVQARPQALAIIQTRAGSDSCITFAQLDVRARKIAALLHQEGIRAGDPVLIFHPVSIDLYTVLLAVFRIGAVAMFLDPSTGREHVDRCCELQPPRALIASPKAHLLRLVSNAVRRIRLKFVCGTWLPGATPVSRADALNPMRLCEPCAPETPALLTFTSGSTGLPKAAVRSHGFLLAQHRVLERHIQLVPDEVDLTTLPVFLLANLASGLTSVIPDADLRAPGLIDPGPVLGQIRRHRVTRAAASPAFFERLLMKKHGEPDALRDLRKIYTGGAPVFPRLLEQLVNAAPNAQVEAVYGSTEAEPIAHLNMRDLQLEDRDAMGRGNGLLAGKVIPEINLRILNDQWGKPLGTLAPSEFQALHLPAEKIGEIVVSGDHVLKGYLHGRGNEETKFSANGEVWHRTGDAGKLDGQGRLWLMGRCSAKVQDARGQLYPFAVECVASEHAYVHRAAFVSHDDRRLLAIELEEGAGTVSLEGLRKDVAWASVDQVLCFGRIPVDKRHNAKIDYPELRRLLAER